MEQQVTNAKSHGGGWVILTYHHICSDIGAADCPADLSTTPTIFNAFVTWLAAQASKGVTVKTVQQVIGGKFNPGVSVSPPAPAAAGVNALTDPGLTSMDSSTGFPTCYQPGGWGTNTVAWAGTTNVPPGSPTDRSRRTSPSPATVPATLSSCPPWTRAAARPPWSRVTPTT